ncbi:DEKNAAC104327 [Brettanomyces naardenensis]|uniref:glucan endo-1,3-beta-D-glucosidase n=1 Tax=Brettanomyces naardenensis TaxID=13370 RepID=A0A448YQT3_BRENA|nr:DEKNAAC104327 [Brettanomyces naardenensis]
MGFLNKLKGKLEQRKSDQNGAPPQQPLQAPQVPARDYQASSAASPLFSPISVNPPPSQIQPSNSHPVPLPSFYKQDGPIETNNFYGNLLVEKQNLPIWTHPYSVWKCDDDQFRGLAVSHTTAKQRVFGDDPNANPCKYFFSPVGICSLVLGASEFQNGFSFRVGECKRFSCGARFEINGGAMSTKLVQGMGFVTGVYEGRISPRLGSKVGIQGLEQKGTFNGLHKYVLTLFDGSKWVLYSSSDGWRLENQNSAVAGTSGNGLVQIARLPDQCNDSVYDSAAGTYVVDMNLSGNVDGDKGTYAFNYSTAGNSSKVIQWFLPHHYASADSSMDSQKIGGLELDSTCKGVMKAYLTSSFTMREQLPPSSLQFDPYKEGSGSQGYSSDAKNRIKEVATQEISSFDVVAVSNTDSMYTSGKILDKGAFMLYVAAFVLQDENLAKQQLAKMKQAFERFISNKQQAPLIYNNTWKGLVSSAGLNDGNFYCDFGNCFYNDHHFHYGYHIHAAALVVLVDQKYGDGTFLNTSKEWIETLIRDVCNPSDKDPYFPVFRSFDFFNGHSFANGLFAHGDGKDEESSSEDYHCYYGVKLWGMVSGNKELDEIGSLILGIERRAMNTYMLYRSDNTTIPANFKANKVSGILFENKIDHATYFGMNREFIHGIHMIPITPISNFMRNTQFVKEEWQEMHLGDLSNQIDSGWKGLLKLNSAIIDPQGAWQFFSDNNFQDQWLDNGMSRTWSLAYCSGMGGH